MPATGVRPPFRTLVAVRAMPPVAAMPLNNDEAMFATPCATNSILDRCRPPIMPSATTADSSDSIAPRSAIVLAGCTTSRNVSRGTPGRQRRAHLEAEPIPDLPGEDDQHDAGGEPGGDGKRNELDRPPSRASSRATRMTPAMSVAIVSPSTPWRSTKP